MRLPRLRLPLLAAIAALLAAGCGSGASASATTGSAATASKAASAGATVMARRRARRRRHPAPNPGTLPQTRQLPSAGTPTFRAEMADLWAAVRTDTLRPGLPAFFPEAAYLQVKSISNPAADYMTRLIGAYRVDISAAHALLGGGARTARLIGVRVPMSYSHWVSPGACYNRIGYYEVPNARMVYRANGQVRSFGIASMISWRGVWYVVHLGAVLQSSQVGVVDDPSVGPGVSAFSSTC